MNDIWLREKERRLVIWQLAEMQPGDPSARAILQLLDDLERLDRDHPLSECQLNLRQLADVPREAHPVGCWVVRDTDLPEPWKSRFVIALGRAARVSEGFYLQDWTEFLDAWEREIEHLKQHRMALYAE